MLAKHSYCFLTGWKLLLKSFKFHCGFKTIPLKSALYLKCPSYGMESGSFCVVPMTLSGHIHSLGKLRLPLHCRILVVLVYPFLPPLIDCYSLCICTYIRNSFLDLNSLSVSSKKTPENLFRL